MRSFVISLFFCLLVSAAFSQTKPNKTSVKTKPAIAPQKRAVANEQTVWDKAMGHTDPAQRVAALKKFIAAYPRSAKIPQALATVVTDEGGLGNDSLAVGDVDAAAVYFKSAAKDAPKPIPDKLYSDVLSKFPANLFFRGVRDAALEIAKKLEERADGNAAQLLDLANFYISIESGSEAKRLAESALKLEPNSARAYQMLGLANRVDFLLEESAAAYARAVELDPEALQAKQGLAEMDRSLGKSTDAINLYREILAKDETNLPAKTGLILAMFEAGQKADAEAELAKSLDQNPGNVMLLAGAAYWYAVHDEGAKAVTFAQKAIDSDPRFIWSHIALARGLIVQNKPTEAERVLLVARRYGNFPTLDYEIASARLAAGLYRDAADVLAKSFSIKDGLIQTKLGGRVVRESGVFTELVGSERRASIFAPTAADDPRNSAHLAALLQFRQELTSPQPDTGIVLKAADDFVAGDDPMRVYRQLFTASQLLEKKVGLAKAIGLAEAAPRALEEGLKIPDPVMPVLASELYESRTLALARGEYVKTPTVPAPMLSAILRGRVEDVTGWAYYEMDNAEQATIHLRRAIGVLPQGSAWWRASNWRLGNALALSGKEAEALDAYIKTYNSGPPDPVRYSAIEGLYKRLKGSTDGLQARIGRNPASPVPDEIASNTPMPEPTPKGLTGFSPRDLKLGLPPGVPVAVDSTPQMATTPEPTPEPATAVVETTPEPSPAAVAVSPPSMESTPEVTTKQPETIPNIPQQMPGDIQKAPSPEPSESTTPQPVAAATVEVTITGPLPVSSSTPLPSPAAQEKPEGKKELFPPVIITIPVPETVKPTPTEDVSKRGNETEPLAEPSPSLTPADGALSTESSPSPSPAGEPGDVAEIKASEKVANVLDDGRLRLAETKPSSSTAVKPCTLTASEDNITLRNGGGEPVMIGRSDESDDLEGLTGISTSPENISIRRENLEGVKTRAIFVVRSISEKAGVYQVKFELPCGTKEIVVRVR